MFKNALNFVKNHKRGFAIGAVITLIGTVAAIAMGTGKGETELIENTDYEVTDGSEEAAEDMVEKIENSEIE
jgi:dissimilatory sulfite reductase (desulfoviridin) alpha/beta subunit